MGEGNNLLLDLKCAVGCSYLSDLHYNDHWINKQAEELILAIPLVGYTLKEWNEAASYITGEKCNFQSVEEARAKIVLKVCK